MNYRRKKSVVALTVMGILNGSAIQFSYAQDASQAVDDVIEISGFRNALIKAKDLKRDAITSTDSILAEDIADFPDLNLADSLQVQLLNGMGSTTNINLP